MKASAVEVRPQQAKPDEIDEIIIRGGTVHIEQMSADGWFIGIEASDGSYWQFWFGAKNRRSAVEFRHTETSSAENEKQLTARRKSAAKTKRKRRRKTREVRVPSWKDSLLADLASIPGVTVKRY